MGKELRVALSVVGALLLAFCALVYGRLTHSSQDAVEASIRSNVVTEAREPDRSDPTLRRVPTIVDDGAWEPLESPYREGEDEARV
jgi:hypothetical protein